MILGAAVPVDGLAPLGAMVSADTKEVDQLFTGTEVIKLGFSMCIGTDAKSLSKPMINEAFLRHYGEIS